MIARMKAWWREYQTCLPCADFEDNGSLGCKRCDWNLAAHSRADQVRVLGEGFVGEYEAWSREAEGRE